MGKVIDSYVSAPSYIPSALNIICGVLDRVPYRAMSILLTDSPLLVQSAVL